ncbi:hypothetical protein KBD34_03850 [Patescibacteria group bacterium]|nr:hypothetical protein [Patescibacteria group bacterium]
MKPNVTITGERLVLVLRHILAIVECASSPTRSRQSPQGDAVYEWDVRELRPDGCEPRLQLCAQVVRIVLPETSVPVHAWDTAHRQMRKGASESNYQRLLWALQASAPWTPWNISPVIDLLEPTDNTQPLHARDPHQMDRRKILERLLGACAVNELTEQMLTVDERSEQNS